ncbi:Glycosyl transferase family 2 [Fibrobacter sp. UWOV1]|jgi:glycosyltransferase involved in cell wall biosynthesis|uniref:glycosyltransferase family 2 protein n=1 Tax=Fibrobacter sp. UWOV1 TaxID=1896215 RepID=UPI000911CE72|nr:glycosyltransferase family 2 protein [Fibrobacter sp. UWOV1]SHK94452.1 Glycosyl transferase family 2 [Fibrobacter sp. UWOV1]
MANDYFIFVPAYNVAGTLASVLEKISDNVWNKSLVLIIDDGSTDDTRSAYEDFASSLAEEQKYRLRYMRFEQNNGYGAVVKKGIAEGLRSGAELVACLHGDGQYPAEQLDEFFDYLKTVNNVDHGDERKFALVQGSRHLTRGGAKAGNMPLYKRLGGTFLTLIENFAFYQKLTDRHSGFIVYDSEFLRTLELDKLSSSFDIDLEIISIADSLGYKLAELPIPTRYADEKSNLNVVTYGLRVLRQVFRRFATRLTA